MAEATRAEQAAYNASVARTKKQAARERGAADALKDAPAGAVDLARAPALGQVESPGDPAVLGTPAAAPSPDPSGQFIQGVDVQGYLEEFFDLSPADQKRFKELMAERQKENKAESRFDQTSVALLNQLESVIKRVVQLEKASAEKDSLIVGLTRLVEAQSNAIEVAKSQALLEQEAAIAQQVTNLSAIRAEARQEAEQHQREREQAASDHRDQLEAQATAIDALTGSAKSTTFLMEQRGNAVESQVAAMEPRVQKLDVSIQELEGKTDAWTDPITRAKVNNMATAAVAEQWQSQLPALVNSVAEELMIQFPDGIHAGRMDSEYVRRQKADAARLADQQQGIS